MQCTPLPHLIVLPITYPTWVMSARLQSFSSCLDIWKKIITVRYFAIHVVENLIFFFAEDFPGESRVRTASGAVDLSQLEPLGKDEVYVSDGRGVQKFPLNKIPAYIHKKNYRTTRVSLYTLRVLPPRLIRWLTINCRNLHAVLESAMQMWSE